MIIMNNFDKIIVKNGRNKYFRKSTPQDIQLKFIDYEDFGYYSVVLRIGMYRKGIHFYIDKIENVKLKEMRKTAIIKFEKNKTEKSLEYTCFLLNLKSKHLLKPSFSKYLLNQEGIEWLKQLINKLEKLRNDLIKVSTTIKLMNTEISIMDPYTKSLYRDINLLKDIENEICLLKQILKANNS